MTSTTLLHTALRLRPADAHDGASLRRLAALDSARPLRGEVLVAEADDVVVAALSLDDGRTVADPMRPTAEVVDLLRTRATLTRPAGSRAGALGRLSRLAPARLRPV